MNPEILHTLEQTHPEILTEAVKYAMDKYVQARDTYGADWQKNIRKIIEESYVDGFAAAKGFKV